MTATATIDDVLAARNAEWRRLVEAGRTIRDVAREYGVAHSTVVRAIGSHAGLSLRARAATTHRGKGTPEYGAWCGMIARCENPRNAKFAAYGGRGIRVCAEWRHDFARFLADTGQRPSPSHSIDRIDVNGNYEPGNVRWATARDQSRNRRVNCWIEAGGRRALALEWARETGIPVNTILMRMRRGWTPAQAVGVDAPPMVGRLSRAMLDAAVADVRAGMSIKAAARKHGCSFGGLWTHVRKAAA